MSGDTKPCELMRGDEGGAATDTRAKGERARRDRRSLLPPQISDADASRAGADPSGTARTSLQDVAHEIGASWIRSS
jgi:hypothetical protein